MKSLSKFMARFVATDDGPTAVEYAVMLALIILVCLTAIQYVGTTSSIMYGSMVGIRGFSPS